MKRLLESKNKEKSPINTIGLLHFSLGADQTSVFFSWN